MSGAPPTDADASPVPRLPLRRADLICVGGIPGAGKTTAIREVRTDLPSVRVLDPEDVYRPLHAVVGEALPYRGWRWLVHGVHTLRLLRRLLAGPSPDRVLVVHEPSTRSRRRRQFVRVARALGWRPALLFVDTDPVLSRAGQEQRGRVLPAASFDRHCARWARLSAQLGEHPSDLDGGRWDQVVLTDRGGAVTALRRLVIGDHRAVARRG